jgi:hypothetical protein
MISNAKELFDEVCRLNEMKHRADALDVIYNNLDERLLNHEFDWVRNVFEHVISNIENPKFPISGFLSILTVSHPWNHELLETRTKLATVLHARITKEENSSYADECLRGLVG